jgi:geranylgeranyl pyrophosphate synthase
MFDFKAYLEERSRLVNNELAARMPGEDVRPGRLHEAMRYAVLAGGKRIRPVLCMAAGECALLRQGYGGRAEKKRRGVQCSVFSPQNTK